MTLDLDSRTGWPDDLRVLLAEYPREVWQGHVNLGELARFWLRIHDGFRQSGLALARGAAEFREIGKLIVEVVDAVAKNEAGDAQVEQSVARRVADLCARFPIYS